MLVNLHHYERRDLHAVRLWYLSTVILRFDKAELHLLAERYEIVDHSPGFVGQIVLISRYM